MFLDLDRVQLLLFRLDADVGLSFLSLLTVDQTWTGQRTKQELCPLHMQIGGVVVIQIFLVF